MTRRKMTDPILFSNILFAINACVWFYVDQVYCAVAMCISFIASVAYHLGHENFRWTLHIDVLSAVVALGTTLYFSYTHLSILSTIYLATFLYLSLYIKDMEQVEYDTKHLLWHICVFIGQLALASSIPLA
jgi:hypothetical protein